MTPFDEKALKLAEECAWTNNGWKNGFPDEFEMTQENAIDFYTRAYEAGKADARKDCELIHAPLAFDAGRKEADANALPELPVTAYRYNDEITIEWRGENSWAVCQFGLVLSKDGVWAYEPMPSSRTEEFLESHRFKTPKAAQEAIKQIDKGA